MSEYSKDFKYTLKSKDGKVLLQSIVSFGSEDIPFPKEWEEDTMAQMALQDYKGKFISDNFDIEISEDLNLNTN